MNQLGMIAHCQAAQKAAKLLGILQKEMPIEKAIQPS